MAALPGLGVLSARHPAARDPEVVPVRRLASPTDETLDLDEDAVEDAASAP